MRALFILLAIFSVIVLQGQPPFSIAGQQVGISWKGHAVEGEARLITTMGEMLKYEIDGERNIIYAVLHKGTAKRTHGTGVLIAYDFKAGKELWQIPFHGRNDDFILLDSVPIVYREYYSHAHHWKTGDILWSAKGQFVSAASDHKIAMGYEPNLSTQRAIIGVDISTGKLLWKKYISNPQNLFNIQLIGDTAWVAESAGLDYTNAKTGKGFHFAGKSTIGSQDNMAYAGSIIAGVLFGVLTGVVIVPYMLKPYNLTGSSQSRWVLNQEGIYYLAANKVLAFDEAGNIIWENHFNPNRFGTGKLFEKDGGIFASFNGYAVSSDGLVYYGTSGFERYDKDSGKYGGAWESEETIRDYILRDSTVLVALDKRIVELSLSNLSVVMEKVYSSDQGVKLGFKKIMNPPGYIYSDSMYLNTDQYFPDNFYAANNGGLKIVFGSDLEMQSIVKKKDYFEVKDQLNSSLFILKSDVETVVVNDEGREVCPISFSVNMGQKGNWLCDRVENELLLYSLGNLK